MEIVCSTQTCDAFISLFLSHLLVADTAVVYRNEQHIGEALKTLLPKHNLKRDDIFITTKLSEFLVFSAFLLYILCAFSLPTPHQATTV